MAKADERHRAGVLNEGYWGVPVRKDAQYQFTLFAKSDGNFAGPIVASLEGADGHMYAQEPINGLGAEWKQFKVLLKSTADDPQARLVIAAAKPCTFWLDCLSLMPIDTWKDRGNGLRTDLAKMLADMKPSFVRFPGGCFVEGFTFETALRWKNTIGPIEERKGHWNLWGYRGTDGLGYHELLQMCEDIGAAPLLVVNCGMTCQGRNPEIVPPEQLDEWIQDTLDAIEYANGEPSSKWGVVRAATGHPASFNLKYMEIGNENSGPLYEERYKRFHDAIKARYPEMKLIANCPVSSAPVDIVDDHYYSSPNFFLSETRHYDGHDRKGPQVYVGEYAVTVECGKGNLRAAVAEAAFLTGLERNGDVVSMSSYAPLFVNANDRTWNPDAIVFDNHRSYGTPSYYVNKMFSETRGDEILSMTLTNDAVATKLAGGVGFATWDTQAEFKDLRVTQGGKVLFASNFKNAEGWKVFKGDWKVEDGV
ncbi:MAG: alpha-N-arabinofuranosidase, partial [Candidatus Hydrogenedentes bacterium]|nr:alpha-N-arabinofuranosidase [Candidatus Hydrogenedentota bacterium]